MIYLKEILNVINKEKEDGFINLEDWRWTDIEHLLSMGFDIVDDYTLKTKKKPDLIIYKKKNTPEEKSKFYIVEPNKPLKRFETFNDVIDYFDSYQQLEFNFDK